MADITVTAAKVAVVYPTKAEIYDFITGVTVTAGQCVYLVASTGKLALADSGAASTSQPRGIALTGGAAGQAISVLKRGHVYGYTLDGVTTIDQIVYVSGAVAGALATATSGTSSYVGRATVLPDNDLTDVLYVNCDWLRTWA